MPCVPAWHLFTLDVTLRLSPRLGHASEAFTLQQYGHVLPGQQADAAARFAQVIDGS
jgi:hypothetical protein